MLTNSTSMSISYILLGLLFAYLVTSLTLHFVSRHLLFRPLAPTEDYPSTGTFATKYGDIHYLYRAHPNAKACILYSHGNISNLSYARRIADKIYDLGYSVLVYDYPGYGKSTGHISPKGVLAAGEVALSFVADKYPVSRIFAYGRSLGGAPSLMLASRYDLAGVIIDSTFLSVYHLRTGARFLAGNYFPNVEWIQNIECPILIYHGKEDDVVPFGHAEKLYSLAPFAKKHVWMEGAGHQDLSAEDSTRYWNEFSEFVNSYSE